MISLEVKETLHGKKCKAVSVRKMGKSIRIGSCFTVNEQGMRRLVNGNTCSVALATESMAIETFEIPRITNDKSKKMLFKSKLASIEKEKDKDSTLKYSVIFFENEEKATNTKSSYTVYGVPEDFFSSRLNLSERSKENIGMYTIDLFGIVAISQKVDRANYVLHVFADESLIHIVFSKGGKLEYSRTVAIPDLDNEEAAENNFYYENINLTYLYIRQNFPNAKMTMLLTGRLFGNKALAAQATEFMGLEPATMDLKQIARGVSAKDFHEYLIPIGVALLDKQFDFSSPKEQAERLIRKIFLYANAALIPALAVMAFVFMESITIFNDKSREMQIRSQNLFIAESNLLKDIGDTNILRYNSNYIDIIRGRSGTAVSLMKPIEDMLLFQKFSNITFEGSGAKSSASLSLEEPQVYYVSIEDLSRLMTDKLDEIRSRNTNVNDNSMHTLKDLKNKIKIVITPKGAK